MDMRVSFSTAISQALASTASTTTQLTQLQAQASTGNRLLEPSDDPAAEVGLLSAQAQDAQEHQEPHRQQWIEPDRRNNLFRPHHWPSRCRMAGTCTWSPL